MLFFFLFVSTVCICKRVDCKGEEDDELGGDLVSQLTADRNLDLPPDDEYEDLRAELLAYHTVLANMVPGGPGALDDAVDTTGVPSPVAKQPPSGRRSFTSTPCWQRGGVCMLRNLCIGPQYLTEVRGCRDKLNVCCFGWNRYYVRDFSDVGIRNLAVGNVPTEYGGKGVIIKSTVKPKPEKRRKKKKLRKSVAVIIKNVSDK